jgi:hypothetical protein
MFQGSRFFASAVVALAAIVQASLLVFEWMELKRARRFGLLVGGVISLIFLSLVVALVIESRSVLVLSVR